MSDSSTDTRTDICITHSFTITPEEGAPQPVELTITQEAGAWPAASHDSLRAMLEYGLQYLLDDQEGDATDLLAPIEIGVTLSSDVAVQQLNRDYRGFDKPTNILSFPGDDAPDDPAMPWLLGDMVLAYETVAREAQALELDFQAHLSHLCLHGLLHLFGYDHVESDEAEEMEAIETALLLAAGLHDPYQEPAA